MVPQLFAGTVDCAEYIACSIYIHDYSKFFEKTDDKWLKSCIERDIVLQIVLEPTIRGVIRNDQEVLRMGVRMVWSKLDTGGPLLPCLPLRNRWYVGKYSNSATSIHYNIATGSMLVGLKPLSILPEEYTQSKLYAQVLQDRLVDVVVSDDPRMEYMTVKAIGGHQLYFGFAGEPNELHIHSRKDGKCYIAILRSKFSDDLPVKLVETSNPWLCIDTLRVEFRNEDQPWSPEESDWEISVVKMNESIYQMQSRKSYLIDNSFGIGSLVCSVLAPLEMSKYIHILLDKKKKRLAIELPRYHLNFAVDQHGQLHCNELAAFVTQSQKLGTFYGLENRLVLQAEGSKTSNPKVWVLIPFGKATVQRDGSHIIMDLKIDRKDELTFYKYRIDKTLRSLVPDQIEGHLWKAYLHACTSSTLPDELTGCTGLEESFRTLDDCWLKTCVPFSVRAQEILEMIANVSCYRSFYPDPGARHMQKTEWNKGMSFMMQHDGYHKKVKEIIFHNQKARFLNEGAKYVIPAYKGNDEDLVLAERAMYAWRKYWPAGFASSEHMPCGDKVYVSRDKGIARDVSPVFKVASSISSWKIPVWEGCDFYEMFKKRQSEASSEDSPKLSFFSMTFNHKDLTTLMNFKTEDHWMALFKYCLETKEADLGELLFVMSMIVFGNAGLLKDIEILLPFAILPKLKTIGLPDDRACGTKFGIKLDWNQYDLSQGDRLDWLMINKVLQQCEFQEPIQTMNLPPQSNGAPDARIRDPSRMQSQKSMIKQAVKVAWKDGTLALPSDNDLDQFDVSKLKKMLAGCLATWKKNSILHDHCKRWEAELAKIRGSAVLEPLDIWMPQFTIPKTPSHLGYPALYQVMTDLPRVGMADACDKATVFDGSLKDMFTKIDHNDLAGQEQKQLLRQELAKLVTAQVGVQDGIKEGYCNALLSSNSALAAIDSSSDCGLGFPDQSFLGKKLSQIDDSLQTLLQAFNHEFRPRSTGAKALRLAGLWPEATTPSLLQLMSKSHRNKAPHVWRDVLLTFARQLCSLQRIERIIRFYEKGDLFAFRKEVENEGHDAWNLRGSMDWLLFEIQNNLLVRPVQVAVATELVKPKNGVIQLQMGDGKSSVILPLFCMSVAAGKTHIVRVVVLKSLANETLANLSKAFSGLVQIPLYWLPFSRATKIAKGMINDLQDLWEECRASSGVLLTLPEHLNSFRLTGNDLLTVGKLDLAQRLFGAQKFLDNYARDIIDESDEVLKPAYELVYTNGESRPLSGTPYRWDVLLTILDVIQTCAEDVHLRFPHGLEYKNNGPGAFATVRILTKEAGVALLEASIDAIFEGALPTLSFEHHDPDTIQAFLTFITQISIQDKTCQIVKPHLQNRQESGAIHLLRGLFAWGFLAAAFEKRFFVNYGLDRTRCFSAVPYRSKGIAATAAEFAQPDMMVLFTALSYYYLGLELRDMRQALTIVMRHPDPSDEYSRWTSESDVPESIRSISSVNLQDDDCVAMIHKHLFKKKTVVDFFLRTVVFQKESKEYPYKLSSSAWDLCGNESGKVTGGFSGTMDSYLPNSMPRTEIDGLMHFDAAVLSSLLHARNRRYVKASDEHGLPLDTETLLHLIEEEAPKTSVIIDVGAQTLDKNQDVAQKWLHIHQEGRNPNAKSAAIFFNELDEKLVITLDGKVSPWASSTYKEQVDSCLIYLDQHHCRGTDIQMPDNFVAALLLGPRLPKDSFVQAAMRLRKLSHGQSIVTFAPPEVDNSIRELVDKHGDKIDIADVIQWVMEQSCDALRAQQTLKVKRNLEWLKRSNAFRNQVSMQGVINNRKLYQENVLQQEFNEVEELYKADMDSLMRLPKFSKQEQQDQNVIDALRLMDEIVDKQAYLKRSMDGEQEQEQEREQQHEREAERETQRPIQATPTEPNVNKWLAEIIMQDSPTRVLPEGLTPAFHLLGRTSLYNDPLWRRFPALLLATRDHLDTVKSSTGKDQDDFLRPVHWVLKLKFVRELILIGPQEAQAWESALRRSQHATLIMYAPKTRRDMKSFDKLDMYTIPMRAEPVQVDTDVLTLLRLFAGQLYFNSFEEYERFCTLLCLKCSPEPQVKGYMRRTSMLKLSERKPKTCEYIPLIKKWINMRRKGVDWSGSDVGRVLSGETLGVRHFH